MIITVAPAAIPTINDGAPRTPCPLVINSTANVTPTEITIVAIAARASTVLVYKPAINGKNNAATSSV